MANPGNQINQILNNVLLFPPSPSDISSPHANSRVIGESNTKRHDFQHLPKETASLPWQIFMAAWMASEDKRGTFPRQALQSKENDRALKPSLTQEIKEKPLSRVLKALTFLSSSFLLQRRLASHGQLPVFVNTVLLEHSHAHSFPDPLRLLSCCNSGAEELQQRLLVAREA